jgi:carbonic anhydrase
MFFSHLALISLLMAAPMGALAESSAAFSYDPTDEYGPANWYKLDIDGNACAGNKNSPIAVETSSCDRYENYRFVVSELSILFTK